MGSLLLQPNVTCTKDLLIYGQNTQIIHYKVGGPGGLKNSYSFTDKQYFIDFFHEIIFLCI